MSTNPCTFAYDATGKITNGVTFATPDPSWSTTLSTITFDDTANPKGMAIFLDQHHYKISGAAAVYTPDSASTQLANAQAAKIAEINTKAEADIEGGFTSSALGSAHTYKSAQADMVLLNGEYSFVVGPDYDNSFISWYTAENGYQNHTAAQFKQVWLDGRKVVNSKKQKANTKRNQAKQCTTAAQVSTIAYPTNPNPPAVPIGLAGTSGTGQVVLNWTANTDITMVGGGGYNVYVDGSATKANASLVTGTTYTATGLTAGSHTFTITAVDTDGLESSKCTAITVNAN